MKDHTGESEWRTRREDQRGGPEWKARMEAEGRLGREAQGKS